MAVAVNNSVFTSGNSTAPSATLSVSGADRCLFICLKARNGVTVSSPQVDGQPLTLIISDSLQDCYTYLYVAPAVGSRTVQATLGSAVDWGLHVVSLTSVDQASPIGTALQASNSEDISISQAVTAIADGLVLDYCVMVVGAMTAGAGQTRYPTSGSNGDSLNGGFTSVGVSAKSGTGSTTMSWTPDGGVTFGDNTLIAVPFRPSSGGGDSGGLSLIYMRPQNVLVRL